MKVLIVTTSPRKSFSTSLYLSKILKLFLMGKEVEIISLKTRKDYQAVIEKLGQINTLVFVTPVYVDSLPSTTLEYLAELADVICGKTYQFDVYALTNCGFYEGRQCSLALDTYELWCKRVGVNWRGGVGIGAGVMIGFMRVLPLAGLLITLFSGFFPVDLLVLIAVFLLVSMGAYIHIFQLSASIGRMGSHGKKFTTTWFCPRFLFVFMASAYWILRALFLHGTLPWKLFSKNNNA